MMSEDLTYVEDVAETSGNGRDNKILIIVAVVLVVLCCCCLIVGGGVWWMWKNGDDLLGLAVQFAQTIL